jgi:hydrogenase maturation protease
MVTGEEGNKMNRTLIIGLGNPLMGDEGIGSHVAEALALDPRLPKDVSVLHGGTDLLRLADKMAGYDRIMLVDAVLDPQYPGRIEIYDDDFSRLKDRQDNAHQLSIVQGVELLRLSSPELKGAQFTLILVDVPGAGFSPGLSQFFQAKLREVVTQILGLVTEEVFE